MENSIIRKEHPLAKEAIARWDEGKADPERAFFEQQAESIALVIRPQRAGFLNGNRNSRDQKAPLSSEPILAQAGMAAGIYSSITNPATNWAGLETPDKDFNNWKPMAEWNDMATRIVMNSFKPSVSSFYSATHQAYGDISAFGNAAGYDEIDRVNRKFIDVTLSLSEVVVWVDWHGRVTEVVRKFTHKPKAALDEFGQNALPPKVAEYAEKSPSENITFFHHVRKNTDFKRGKIGSSGKRWLSTYSCEIESWLVKQSGYDDMPFYFPRWDVESGWKYGTGLGFIALASANVNQQLTASEIRMSQKSGDPTLLAPDRAVWPLSGQATPGKVLYGAVNAQGSPLVHPLNNIGNYQMTESQRRQVVEAIKEVFQYSIMSIVGRTGMTTEETMIQEEARLRNWAPNADRIMEEYGARKVERRFSLLWAAGQIPPPPEDAAGKPLMVRYQSAATMALRANEGLKLRQFLSDLGPLASVSEEHARRVAYRMDADGLIEALHDASPNLPASVLRSRDEADKMADAEAQRRSQAEMIQMAQAGGGIAKDLAQAEGALQGGVPA